MDEGLSLKLQQMRLRDLLLLAQIAELGSLRRVAEAQHITQPAITQSLKALELAFGVSLVARGRSGARLTAAGEAVLTRVNAAGEELREAQRAAIASASPVLRVGSSPAAMLTLVPMALAKLWHKAPQIGVVLSETGVAALWDKLDDGAFDVIVTRLPNVSQGRPMPEGLAFQRIGQEKMVLVCAQDHPAIKGRMSAAALAQQPWAMPPADALAVLMLNEWFAQAGVRTPTPRVTCGSFYASLQMVARSELVTIAPESALQALRPGLKLKTIDARWSQSHLDIVFACRAASQRNPALQVLRSCFD